MLADCRLKCVRTPAWALLLATALAVLTGCQTPNSVLRQDAWMAIQENDLARADARLRVAVEQDPADWQSRLLMGRVCLAQGRALDAQLHLEHALNLHPDGERTPQILDMLAESFFQQQELDKLTAFLAQHASQRKGVADYLRQARFLARMGDSDGVNAALLKAARFAPADDLRPYLAAAEYYESIGERDRAVTALRHAHYIAPANESIAHRLRAHGVVPGPAAALPPLSTTR